MARDPKKPYGDVAYADPGYQSDGVHRYPLDTERHCRAAWSYINQSDNAAKYTAEQLRRIRGRIRAALERYGVDVEDDKGAGVTNSKSFQRVEIKSADKGQVSAVFATLNVIDKDGDVTLPGAFEDGAEVLISSYQHTSWQGALPVGMGRIRVTKDEAILEGQFFMDTGAGRDTFAVIKKLGEKQEWSYGYDTVEAEQGVFDGRDVQFLKQLTVHEVSPVLIGAGVNTRTLDAKSRKDGTVMAVVTKYDAAIRVHDCKVTTKRWDDVAAVATIPDDATINDLREMYAYVDPTGDPALKSSYDFAHHHGIGGEANLRACLAGIADLNGTKGADMSDVERKAVYDHLAHHLEDGDRDVPELREPGSTGARKYHEEAADVLAGLERLIKRTSEVMALRRSKGKAISASTVDILEWISDADRRLRAQLDSPQEDVDREYARYVQSLLQTPGEEAA